MGLLGQVSRDVMVRPRSRGRLGGRQAICNGRGDSGNCERRVAEAVGKENGFTKYNGMIKDALSCRVAIMEVTTVFLFSFMLSAATSTTGKKKLKYSTELVKRPTKQASMRRRLRHQGRMQTATVRIMSRNDGQCWKPVRCKGAPDERLTHAGGANSEAIHQEHCAS